MAPVHEAHEVPVDTWQGCYDGGWKDLIVPQAFAHPAKLARGLAVRIFDYLFDTGALQKGDVVVDPFGGIGTTAIEGAGRGVQVVCCELEPKFVDLARQNFALHRPVWRALNKPEPVIVQGDSRQLRRELGAALGFLWMERVDALVSSPPFADLAAGAGGLNTTEADEGQQGGRSPDSPSQTADQHYGATVGQLSILPAGDVDAVVSSPPYEGNVKSDRLKSEDGKLRAREARQGFSQGAGCFRASEDAYGTTPGQLGQMAGDGGVDAVVSSPPYSPEGLGHAKSHHANTNLTTREREIGKRSNQPEYGDAPGQLSKLESGSVDAVVSSPPFGFHAGGGGINTQGYRKDGTTGPSDDKVGDRTYQGTAGDRSPANLESLVLGEVDAVVSSPPYVSGGHHPDQTGAWNKNGGGNQGISHRAGNDGYGREDGQLGKMEAGDVDAVVASPPYEGSLHHGEDGIAWDKAKNGNDGGSQTPGQSVRAAYPVAEKHTSDMCEAVVTSPPYEDIERANHQPGKAAQAARAGRTDAAISYGQTAGNMGNVSGETFWSAALQIVRESYAILKPGGTAVWIVKAFVRNKTIVDFPGDWRKLCEHVGFELVLEARAMLVAEETRTDLFGAEVTTRRERKSFFRRLAEKKGSPRIDWETVLVMKKRG